MSDRKKILFVDDEVDLGETIKEILEDGGYDVEFYSKPKEALERLEKETFSIILSDYNMPDLNGQQLIQHVRAKGFFVPVVFLTGMANKDFVMAILRLGASDVLEKPCSPEVLLGSIQRVIEIEKRRGEIYARLFINAEDPEIQQKLKMLGLMQVVNQMKKSA